MFKNKTPLEKASYEKPEFFLVPDLESWNVLLVEDYK